MTKLKGTILLGEGYNKTKAVFNGNIDNLEVKSISIKDSTARDILLGNGTTLPLFNGSNTINSQYLPSYVDDVIEAPSQNDFPVMGESGKIYLDISTNSTYRWSGSTYVLITSGDVEAAINDIVNQIQEVENNATTNTQKIDTLEGEVADIQKTLKKEDPYLEYYEYEHVPLTIEALGDGAIEFLPSLSSNIIEGSLDGGETWVNITNNPILLVYGDKLLLRGSIKCSEGKYELCGNLITNFPYNAFGNPSKLLNIPAEGENEIDYEYIFSAFLAILNQLSGLVMHKLLEQSIEGFESLSFQEKVAVVANNMSGKNLTEEELLTVIIEIQKQFGNVSFLYAISEICNVLQPLFPDLNVDEDFLLELFKSEMGEDVTLHDTVAMLYKEILGRGDSNEYPPYIIFQGFLSNNIVSAENLYLDKYTITSLLESTTLQIAPKVIDLDRFPDFTLAYLFRNCTALILAPELPATKLSRWCYLGMFRGCTSLTTAPKLPATTLADECYQEMFLECTSLTTAPELPAMTLEMHCYKSMFEGCISLTTAPELLATTLSSYCYNRMFNGCTSLVNVPKILPATTAVGSCYLEMFQDCSSLSTAPDLPATEVQYECYSNMFRNCTSLRKVPKILPAKALASDCYRGMFEGCSSLTTAPELPATTLADYCYASMFKDCIRLFAVPKILPATTLAYSCYFEMFYYCELLKTAPELPARTLVSQCYTNMFSGCTKLNYIKMIATNISADGCLSEWVFAVTNSIESTFVKAKGIDIPIGKNGIPKNWAVEEYLSPEDQLKELQVSVDSNTEEIDILKNRIISTTYSELKDAVTNSTLTTGQYYRITDYVTTCNGTSAKVTDASTIDPENPVDGQSRSAGHLFDIIVRALSPNQLDENAVAVCNASETYYDSTFNGTVVKYSIENKYWSTEDGKGTIYYMKDHNDNECSYDFTNIEYYYAESTTWYLTFNKDSSKVVILNTNTVLPFVIIYGYGESPNSITITGSLLEIYMYAGAINAVNIKGTINNFKVIAPNNVRAHTINVNGMCETVLLLSLGIISTITLNGYINNIAMNVAGNLSFCTVDGQHQNLDVKVLGANAYCGIFNLVGQSKNCSINVPKGSINCFFVRGYLWETVINAAVLNTLIDGTLSSSNITASELNKVNFNGLCDIVTINSSKGITHSNFDTVKNIEITGGNHTISQLTFMKNTLSIKLLPYNELAPSYIIFEPRVFNITIEGGALNITLTNVARNLHLKSSQESAIAADVTINGIRGVSAESLLEIPMDLVVKGGCKKDIYGDLSGRIFYTWEDNLVKKGYYINDNTDTEWKEIPTPEEPVEVPTIPDAVTTALSVATLDLTTRTTIATIAIDETLAFTLVPAIQGEYRLVVVNSSDVDITVTMPTEENYQCLCGATLTIPAQTNIELIINVTDTLIYIRKG